MNEQTAALLQKLAEKLGVASEHLWAVLVRQAPITAMAELCTLIVSLGFWIIAFRFVNRKTTPSGDRHISDWDNEGKFFAWGIIILSGIVTVILLLVALTETLTAFVNPEYWALREILRAVK